MKRIAALAVLAVATSFESRGFARPLSAARVWLTGVAAGAQEEPDPFALAKTKCPKEIIRVLSGRSEWSSEYLLYRITPRFCSTSVKRVRCERSSTEMQFQCLENTESTNYLLTALASRLGGQVAYLAGILADGTCVVERWVTDPRPGGWSVGLSGPPTPPLGIPALPLSFVRTAAHTPTWQPAPIGQAGLGPISRSTVFTSPFGPITAMDVDPEGRFLLYYDLGIGALFQRDLLQPNAPPTILAQSSTTPTLTQVGSLELHEFDGEGRKCLVRRAYGSPWSAAEESYLVLHDAENDGHFEGATVLSQAQWEASPYADWSKWRLFWKE